MTARRLWAAVEPLHAVVYFAPETAAAAKAAGLAAAPVAAPSVDSGRARSTHR